MSVLIPSSTAEHKRKTTKRHRFSQQQKNCARWRFNHLAHQTKGSNTLKKKRARLVSWKAWHTKKGANVNIIWSSDERGGIHWECYAHRLWTSDKKRHAWWVEWVCASELFSSLLSWQVYLKFTRKKKLQKLPIFVKFLRIR